MGMQAPDVPKYALVDERLGRMVGVLGEDTDEDFTADDAYALADILRPKWREEGLKLWLRVGQQS